MKKLILILMAAVLAPATGSIQAQEPDVFGDVLNKCLSNPRVSLVDCARIAGSIAEIGEVKVIQEFAAGDSEWNTREAVLGDCVNVNNGHHGHSSPYQICSLYDCKEDAANNISVCDRIGSCGFNQSFSECW